MQNLKSAALPVPEIIGGGIRKQWAVPGYAHAPFSPKFLMGFCSDGRSEMNIPAKCEIRSFSRSWDNRGRGTLNISFVPRYAHASFSSIFFTGYYLDRHCYCSNQMTFVALPIPEIIVIGVWGWGVNPQSWGRGGLRGSWMVPFERAKVSSYRVPIVTFL